MTTKPIEVNRAKEWLLKEESAVVAFEGLLMEMVEEMEATVVYDDNCPSAGAYYFEGSRILLPTRLQERTEGLNQSMIRIMTIAHEAGHHLDYTHYYDSNIDDYMETDMLILEQDAWEMAVHILEGLDFGDLGDTAWDILNKFIVKCLSGYYMTQRGLERPEARREAAIFAHHLLKLKKEEVNQA